EAYQAFGDYESMMELVEEMICHVAQKVLGTLVIKHDRTATIKSVIENTIERLETECLAKLRQNVSASDEKSNLVSEFVQAFESTASNLKSCLAELGKQPSHEIAMTASKVLLHGISNAEKTKTKAKELEIYQWY